MEGEVENHTPSGNARDEGILANLVVGDGVQIEKSRQLSPIKFLSFGPGKDEWTALPSAPPSPVIADVSDNDADSPSKRQYSIRLGAMRSGVRAWQVDRAWWYAMDGKELPDWLEGADLVANRRFDGRRDDFQLPISLSRAATLFVFHDLRNPPPQWLVSGFHDTGHRLRFEDGVSASPVQRLVSPPFGVWTRECRDAGVVNLGPAGAHHQIDRTCTYAFAAKALP
jgi:hypothetical protein